MVKRLIAWLRRFLAAPAREHDDGIDYICMRCSIVGARHDPCACEAE
jgi:hypothetical protein